MILSVCNIVCKNKRVEGKVTDESIIYTHGELSHAIYYYWWLKLHFTTNEEVLFTIDSLLENMNEYINIKGNLKRHRIYVKKFIHILVERKLLINFKNISIDNIKWNQALRFKFNTDMEHELGYFFVDETEIEKIFNYKGKVNHVQLFNTYCLIASCIFQPRQDDFRAKCEQFKYFAMSFEFFNANNIVKNKKVYLGYLKILSDELDLIRFANAGEMYNDKDVHRMGVNHFVLTRDYPKLNAESEKNLWKYILGGYKKKMRNKGWHFKSK